MTGRAPGLRFAAAALEADAKELRDAAKKTNDESAKAVLEYIAEYAESHAKRFKEIADEQGSNIDGD